jgi:hypothetical protein
MNPGRHDSRELDTCRDSPDAGGLPERLSKETAMQEVQRKWDEMCDAYAKDDWGRVEKAALELQQLLDSGDTPIVTSRGDLGDFFQLALAEAGVNFMLELIVERQNA